MKYKVTPAFSAAAIARSSRMSVVIEASMDFGGRYPVDGLRGLQTAIGQASSTHVACKRGARSLVTPIMVRVMFRGRRG